MKPELSSYLIERWRLEGAILIADTFTSQVYRAKRNGSSVIVKRIKLQGQDELSGIAYLRWRNGQGAAKVLDLFNSDCLMEDAGETTLLQFHEAEGEDAANAVIAKTLPTLFKPATSVYPQSLPSLREALADLFVCAQKPELGEFEEPLKLAAGLAEMLLASQTRIQPLHGDIHHGNIVTRDVISGLPSIPRV